MRKLSVLGAVIALTLSIAVQAGAATPGALSPAQASANCEAFFGVGRRTGAALALPVGHAHDQCRRRPGESHRQGRDGRRDRWRRRLHPPRPGRRPRCGRSCSFIYSDTPTADPAEIANGDCSNKAAVQDLKGHGTHVATTIAGRVNGIGIVGVAPRPPSWP